MQRLLLAATLLAHLLVTLLADNVPQHLEEEGEDAHEQQDDDSSRVVETFYLTLDAILEQHKGNHTELLGQLRTQYPGLEDRISENDLGDEDGDDHDGEAEKQDVPAEEEEEENTERNFAQFILETAFADTLGTGDGELASVEELISALHARYAPGVVVSGSAEGDHDEHEHEHEEHEQEAGEQEPSVGEPSASGDVCLKQPLPELQAICAEVRQFYMDNDLPGKLGQLDKILFRYKGNEAELLGDLKEKYNGIPASTKAASTAKRKGRRRRQLGQSSPQTADPRTWTTSTGVHVTVQAGPTADECDEQSVALTGRHLRVHYTGYITASNEDATALAVGGASGGKYTTSLGGAATEFRLGGDEDGTRWVIAAWDDGLVGVCKGAKVSMVVPPSQAYEDEGNIDANNGWGDVPGGATLYFEMEVVSVQDHEQSGGAIFSLGLHDGPKDRCTGAAVAANGSIIAIHYTGKIDESSEAGEPDAQFSSSRATTSAGGAAAVDASPYVLTLGAGDVIRGLDEALLGLCAGHKGTLVVPPELGYGSVGSAVVPPGATLFYDIEVISVKAKALD